MHSVPMNLDKDEVEALSMGLGLVINPSHMHHMGKHIVVLHPTTLKKIHAAHKKGKHHLLKFKKGEGFYDMLKSAGKHLVASVLPTAGKHLGKMAAAKFGVDPALGESFGHAVGSYGSSHLTKHHTPEPHQTHHKAAHHAAHQPAHHPTHHAAHHAAHHVAHHVSHFEPYSMAHSAGYHSMMNPRESAHMAEQMGYRPLTHSYGGYGLHHKNVLKVHHKNPKSGGAIVRPSNRQIVAPEPPAGSMIQLGSPYGKTNSPQMNPFFSNVNQNGGYNPLRSTKSGGSFLPAGGGGLSHHAHKYVSL